MSNHAPIDLPNDMASVADELDALAQSIRRNHSAGSEAARARQTSDGNDNSADEISSALNPRKLLALAEQAYADRRRRDRIIGQSELFGEPAWDILLDLFIVKLKDRDVSVSSACIGSAAPPTTGLRWLGVLEDNGLVLREKDLADQRRILVRISDEGVARMRDYFETLSQPPKQPLPA